MLLQSSMPCMVNIENVDGIYECVDAACMNAMVSGGTQ